MSHQEKVHVFLGAPPAASLFQSENQEHLTDNWRSVDLNWSDGRLRPRSEMDGPYRKNPGADAVSTEDLSSDMVQEYLDLSYPKSPISDLAPDLKSRLLPENKPLSVQTEHLSTWTQSHAMILKGQCSAHEETPTKTCLTQTSPSDSSSTPELFSPEVPSGSRAPRVQEEGVVLEITTDGLLCSQEAEQPVLPSGAKNSRPSPSKLKGPQTDGRNSTTLLSQCQGQGARYTILVAVVHPCHLKEVKVKSGPNAGTLVPLASIVVTDQSNTEMKVVLWRHAAFWVLAVGPGDILLISGLQVNEDRWRGETILQSSFKSKLLNLGQATLAHTPPARQQVRPPALKALCDFLREQRPLLMTLPLRRALDLTRLPYSSLASLRVNTLVHARLRVAHCYTCTEWKHEAESRFRSALQQSAVVTVEQQGGLHGTLLLWGGATRWLHNFQTKKDTLWDVRFLLVREGSSSERPELHSTPWTSVQVVDALRHFDAPSSGESIEMDLKTLLSQKYTGEVTLPVQVMWFQFQSPRMDPQPVLDSSTSSSSVLAALSAGVTYTGCARCGAELDTDANDIYRACYPCLPYTCIRTFYRPAVLMLSGPDQSQVCVQVPPAALQGILETSPQKIHKQSAGSDQHLRTAAEKILNLVALPKKTFTVSLQSVFMCDENNVVVSQEFTLLHVRPQGDPRVT